MSLLTSPSHLSIFLSLYKEPRVQSLKMDPILKWHLGFSMGKMVLFHSLENCLCLVGNHPFNPLAAKAATISLSAFGPGGPFGFDFFSNKPNRQNNRSSQKGSDSTHESQSNEWLESRQCPIAKSYRAVSGVLPLVAKVLKHHQQQMFPSECGRNIPRSSPLPQWFAAVHAAVPFIVMLRKSVLMPKTAMAIMISYVRPSDRELSFYG